MKTNDLVSIIIPCYNAEKFISETVQSALNQNYSPIEVIVVNDGSTDSSLVIVEKLAIENANLIIHNGANRGVSFARNTGTDMASGKYIQYVDSDDLLDEDAIAKRVDILESNNADVAYSDWQELVETENNVYELGAIKRKTIEDVNPDPEIALFSDFWCPPVAILYTREIVNKIGQWNTSLPIIQDARFALDAALQGAKFVHIEGVGAYYRIAKEESLSRRSNYKFVKDCLENGIQVENIWRSRGHLDSEKMKVLGNLYDYTARTMFVYDKKLFVKNMEMLNRLNPKLKMNMPKVAYFLYKIVGIKLARIIINLLGKIPHVNRSLVRMQ
ncbi:MAG: glycosyltransferase [Gammaproteobacteria bacterium]|nr:glycosyltransferase [Gammaproteobacteria bacterium]